MKNIMPLLMFCLTATIGAARSATPPVGGELPITGHIGADIAARLHVLLGDGKAHILRVNSSGGDDLPALSLAQDIRQSHSTLIVDGLCAGPCANYLFVAASRRIVQPGALVIFSSSATSRLAMVPAARSKDVADNYASTAAQERQLLAGTRVDPALLLDSQRQLGIDCYSLTSHNPAGKAYINFKAQFIGWVPSREYLAHVGIKSEGFWPGAALQFQTALQNAFPGGARGNIAYSGVIRPAPSATLLAELGKTRECDEGLPRRLK